MPGVVLALMMGWPAVATAAPESGRLADNHVAKSDKLVPPHLPGAVNMGWMEKGGGGEHGSHMGGHDYGNVSKTASHLNNEMVGELARGNFQQSGSRHFNGDPREDVPLLAAAAGETVRTGSRCPADVVLRQYNISAINVEITLNQWGDFYPGYMYVLTGNIGKVREEEARNEAARNEENGPMDPGAVSQGLSGDLIQPLAIRANQGECLVLKVENRVEGESISLHIHGSSTVVQATGKPALSNDPDTHIKSGASQVFEWYLAPDEQEGVHQFHSHARDQASTGLFGAVTVEPAHSRHLDPYTGKEIESGWLAMIEDPNGPDFREFVIIYHETGDEEFRPLDKFEEMIPLLDPVAGSYRPATRAINYRSEPFGRNLTLQKQLFDMEDESLAYSAYFNGDTVTPIPRSYIGDPAKWRIVHGGSEVFHSHHLHGGAIRWRRQNALKQDLDLFGTSNFTLAASGPVKFPPVRTASDRIDTQTIGPAESYSVATECGTGGCQHGAGDFLYHCHIPHHYVAGMWAYWRAYNTLQEGDARTDVMPSLAELPDRKGRMKRAVNSTALVGKTLRQFGKTYKITAKGGDKKKGEYAIADWVETQLPPRGKPGRGKTEIEQIKAYDASVWDWEKEDLGNGKILYRGEPETSIHWPKYRPELMGLKHGDRPKILFDPKTGKVAYPLMHPHFGKRPPFPPGRNGAPFLEPIHERADGSTNADVPAPGENGPWSLCPAESNSPAQRKFFNLHAILLPITNTPAQGDQPAIIDPYGQLYVNHEEEAAIRADDGLKIPLTLRMNVHDCADIILSNEIPDYKDNLSGSKVNMHIHFVQFDTQASDGVITGMSFEQSVRPFNMLEDDNENLGKPQNEPLVQDVEKGALRIVLRSSDPFQPGAYIGIGMDAVGRLDIRTIKAIEGDTLVLNQALDHPHKAGEIVSTEFVRYRWYADADFGISYWHDHAFGLTSWAHGLFGATVIEPKGSTYHHPVTGEQVRSGSIVDIHTTEAVSQDVQGSFREFVMQIQDANPRTQNRILSGTVPATPAKGQTEPQPINPLGDMDSWSLPPTVFKYLNGGERTTGGSFGLRVEPLNMRLAENPDPSLLFSSRVHGDPDTPLLRAYLGDPIVLRALDHAGNEMHTLRVQGHHFPLERYGKGARRTNALHLGIGERYDLAIPAAGGPQKMAGDYMYRSGRVSHFGEGMWGLIRVLDEPTADLQPLPGHEEIAQSATAVCPSEMPVKRFNVSAIDLALDLNPKAPAEIKPASAGTNRKILTKIPNGKIYVLDDEVAPAKAGTLKPHPLTLHVNVGDCIEVRLSNRTAKGRVSFHTDLLAYDPHDSLGIDLGDNRGGQTVAPGESRIYTFYAAPEVGEAAALVSDYGDVTSNPRNGLYGGIIIGPKGSRYFDARTGKDVSLKNSWMVDVVIDPAVPGNEGRSNYRDASLFFQDEDNVIGTMFMPYTRDSAGLAAVNYRIEPFAWRSEHYGCEFADSYSCNGAPDPATPVLDVHAGDPLRVHVFGAHGEQNSTFSIENHEWPLEPEMEGAELLGVQQFGGGEVLEINLPSGGPYALPGDYLWMSHRLAYAEAGQWGLLRVLPADDHSITGLRSYGRESGSRLVGSGGPARSQRAMR
jgi:FtsP/CotA-like multicopper oxidase with cupredoxin domain